jgi:glycosyltransferase involved in cell wall biosynthesis
MTRLVHLAGYTPAQSGSFIPFVLSVLSEGRHRGWSVEAVFPDAARGQPWVGEFEQAEVPVRFAYGSRRELTEWVRGHYGAGDEPTILHTHFTVYDVPAALTARGRPNTCVYWHVHTVLSDRPQTVLANAVKFAIFGRYVNRILSPSAGVASAVKRRFGPKAKISVFPSPIDPSAFPLASDEDAADFRRELGLANGTQPLLHFGRDWRLKDGDIFLDALAVLVEQGRPVVGLINQGGEEARLGAARRGLEQHVRLVGMLPDAKKLYGAAELLVASSRGEAMPFTVVEALCCGIPVVASDLPGHRFLGDELEACTIAPRDAEQIASAIAAFLDMEPSERARQLALARSWIVERLDVKAAAQRLVDDYERTIRRVEAKPEVEASR